MLTIQPYQTMNYSNRTSFGCKTTATNVKELSEASQKLIKDVMELVKADNKNTIYPVLKEKMPNIYRSKRFMDGSFVEIKRSGQPSNSGINLRYMRMNQRPVELDINANGDIKRMYSYQNQVNVDNIVEKYFPDIIERTLYY